jgi:cell division protein FtsB
MPTMIEMVEAHLMNVQREIQTLSERKTAINQEIAKLQTYATEGVSEVERAKALAEHQIEAKARPQSTIFDPAIHGGQRP